MISDFFEPGRLKKARDYIRDGLITDIEEVEDCTWSALVSGSDEYDIKISLDGKSIVSSVCSCPDDLAQYCKHIAAVYLVVTGQDKVGAQKKAAKGNTREQRNKDLKNKVGEYVIRLDEKGLRGLINQLRTTYPLLNEYIYQTCLPPDSDVCAEMTRILKGALSRPKRAGYFDRQAGREWRDALGRAFEMAEKLSVTSVSDTVKLCAVIYDVAVSVAGTIDDSNGEFGEAMYPAVELSYEYIKQIQDAKERAEARKTILSLAKKYAGDGWSSSWSWLKDIALTLDDYVQINEVNLVLEYCLNADAKSRSTVFSDSTFFDDYHDSLCAEIRYSVIDKFLTIEDLSEFVIQNSQYHRIREKYVDKLLSEDKLTEARIMSEQSIELDKKYPGVVVAWVTRLQDIAVRTDDNLLLRRTSRTLFESKGDTEQLKILKDACGREWESEYKRLLSDVLKGSRHIERILYIFESQYGALARSLVGCGIEEVESYDTHLRHTEPEKLADMYMAAARLSLKDAAGRGSYMQVARVLRRVKKLGKSLEVVDFVAEMIKLYPARRAMIEELSGV
jgi:SWIM zinc finger